MANATNPTAVKVPATFPLESKKEFLDPEEVGVEVDDPLELSGVAVRLGFSVTYWVDTNWVCSPFTVLYMVVAFTKLESEVVEEVVLDSSDVEDDDDDDDDVEENDEVEVDVSNDVLEVEEEVEVEDDDELVVVVSGWVDAVCNVVDEVEVDEEEEDEDVVVVEVDVEEVEVADEEEEDEDGQMVVGFPRTKYP